MRRLFKHIGVTLLLILLAGGVTLLPQTGFGIWGTVFVWGALALSAGVLVWAGWHFQKRLSVLILILLGGMMTGFAAHADEARCLMMEEERMYQCLIELYGETDFCKIEKEFDADDAVKNNTPPDSDAVEQAIRYLSFYEQAVNAGYATLHGWASEFFTGGLVSRKYEDRRDCAEDFLTEVADYRQKKSKMEMQMVYPILLKERGKCWPCEIVSMVMTVSESLAFSMDDSLREAALMLLGVMFLFWILFQVLGMIQKMGAFRPSEFFTDFLIRSILVIIMAVLLAQPIGKIYEYTLSPVASAVSAFNGRVIQTNVNNALGTRLVGLDVLTCDCCTEGATSNCSGGQILNTRSHGVDIGIFEMESKRQLMCMTCQVYKQTQPMIAAGQVMLYYSWYERNKLGIPTSISVFFIGLALIICFVWISFSIAFRIIDLFLYLGFVILLTPFAMATFVFPKTRSYTKRTWDLFAYALASLLGITISIVLIMAILNTNISPANIAKLHTLMTMQGTVPNKYAVELAEAFGDGDNGTFFTLFFFLMLCFFGLNVIKASQKLVTGLFDIACVLPRVAGAAMVAMGRMAMSAVALTTAIIGDKMDPNRPKKSPADKKDQVSRGKIAHQAKRFSNQIREKGEKLAKKAEQISQKTSALAGKLGTIPGLGVVAAGIKATAVAASGLAKGVRATSRATALGIRRAGQATQRAHNAVKRPFQKAQRAWNRATKPIANRMRQVGAAYQKAVNAVRSKIPMGMKNAARRSKAALKYGARRAGKAAVRGMQKMAEKAQGGLDVLDDSFSNK